MFIFEEEMWSRQFPAPPPLFNRLNRTGRPRTIFSLGQSRWEKAASVYTHKAAVPQRLSTLESGPPCGHQGPHSLRQVIKSKEGLSFPLAGVSNLRPKMALSATQYEIVNLLNIFFFCSSVFISVCVFNVWPKTALLPMWLRDTKRLDTSVRWYLGPPVLFSSNGVKPSSFWLVEEALGKAWGKTGSKFRWRPEMQLLELLGKHLSAIQAVLLFWPPLWSWGQIEESVLCAWVLPLGLGGWVLGKPLSFFFFLIFSF